MLSSCIRLMSFHTCKTLLLQNISEKMIKINVVRQWLICGRHMQRRAHTQTRFLQCYSLYIGVVQIFLKNYVKNSFLTLIWRYYSRVDAENALRFVNGSRLDDRIIRTDWDAGFKEGRQYGRGKSGGQVSAQNIFFHIILWKRLAIKCN